MTAEPTSTPAVTEPVSVAVEPQQVAEALIAEAPNAREGEIEDSESSVKEGAEKNAADSERLEAQAQEGNDDDDDDFPRFDGDQPRAPIRSPVSGSKGSKPSVRR